MNKYKSKTVPELIKIATRHFNAYIRKRDAPDGFGKCISSGRFLNVPGSQSQAGHYYPAGHYPALRFDEDNVHLQSKSDNYFKSGNLIEYRKNLERKIGKERLMRLDQIADNSKRTSFKWDRHELIQIIEIYKKKHKCITTQPAQAASKKSSTN